MCTTELWDALKSFILTSLKFKVAPYAIIVSLDTLKDIELCVTATIYSISSQPFVLLLVQLNFSSFLRKTPR